MSKPMRDLWLLTLLIVVGLTVPVSAAGVLETFESSNVNSWAVGRDTNNNGISRSSAQAAAGTHSARLHTARSSQKAALYATYNEPGPAHQWNERPGTWLWQRASVYLPSSMVALLEADEYLTLAGMYASANPGTFGWYLRVGQGGALSVVGTPHDGNTTVFNAYGKFPTDRWVDVEIGLHSQNGPGVKRAFAFLIDGEFYGWYRQGRLTDETYNRAAFGILSTNSPDALDVYVDQWRIGTATRYPDGPDNRSTDNLQEQDFRTVSGVQVQYDWSTWKNNLVLHPTYGLYSANDRLQAGRNLDRMPSVADGWGEIEIDWPNGTPPDCINGYCSAMIGFRKEINREENLEIIPHADASGTFYLWFEAWTGNPVKLAEWRIPDAEAVPGRNMPEPGDIIRARWEQVSGTELRVSASYYDASAGTWFKEVIDHTFNATRIVDPGDSTHVVNYLDGYHDAASITIDSPYYSIRRFKVGTLETYDESSAAAVPTRNVFHTAQPALSWSRVTWAAGYAVEVARQPSFDSRVFETDTLGAGALSIMVGVLLADGVYFWRVRARRPDGSWGGWSATDSFVVDVSP